MMKIAVTTSTFAKESAEPLEMLRGAGFDVVLNPYGRKLTRDETVALLGKAEAVVAGTEALDRAVLEQLPRLKMIARVGTGMENVDLGYASERGIRVCNTPDGPTWAVAELALAGLLALLRRVPHADAAIRRGEWDKPMGRLLHGRTVGVIGLGRIGKAWVRLLRPFEVNLLAVDPQRDAAFAREAHLEYGTLAAVLPRCDIVSMHLSGAPKAPMIGRAEIETMKRGALLMNLARGGWVDEAALAEALASGQLGGAYLDVFEQEPYAGPLRDAPNVVLTPHIGSYAVECRIQMELDAARQVIDFFSHGGQPSGERST
jgi:D-3-phosphoglycerate dehydrogenase